MFLVFNPSDKLEETSYRLYQKADRTIKKKKNVKVSHEANARDVSDTKLISQSS